MVTRTVFKQIRGFVIVWLAITALVSLATFSAVYFTYNPEESDPASSNPLPLDEPLAEAETNGADDDSPGAASSPTLAPASTPPSPEESARAQVAAGERNLAEAPSATTMPTPLPVDPMRFQVGIQIAQPPDFQSDEQDNWYRSATSDLGLKWIKQQIRWNSLETRPGAIDWSALEDIMRSARKFDVKLLLSVAAAPDWAREPDAVPGRRGPPLDPQTYSNFVAEIVKRYPGRVHAIEVWSAQNTDSEWASIDGLSAAKYVDLLRSAYTVIKAADPGIIVISGALAPTGVNDGLTAANDFAYMQQMIEAGLLDWADCIGAQHNGYNIGPDHRYDEVPQDAGAIFRGPFDNPHHSWSFRSTLEGYANTIRSAGKTTKLCVTKFGWASVEDLDGAASGVIYARDNSLTEQAEWLQMAMSNMEAWGFIWLAFIWNLNYGPLAGYDIANDNIPYSLIGPGFKFRPAFAAIRDWQQDYRARAGQ